ncbi:hypothetical protein COU60_02355 [Candidatus Pacearchaeota archaeon CG10_big_fil_rev_8_21_14_0_10_34_76]|nr:MAG: hypothetical protein COU60_02355 [Candidatus Pacearchaeota archaeon CG10_big_fil_rev_8_21_14_0_10_34_76]
MKRPIVWITSPSVIPGSNGLPKEIEKLIPNNPAQIHCIADEEFKVLREKYTPSEDEIYELNGSLPFQGRWFSSRDGLSSYKNFRTFSHQAEIIALYPSP